MQDFKLLNKSKMLLKYLYDNDFNSYYTGILSYKEYFIRCNTKLYFDKYSKLCINNIYDKYIIIKNKYKDYMVFIKIKYRYYTYDKEDKGKYIILKGNIMEVNI